MWEMRADLRLNYGLFKLPFLIALIKKSICPEEHQTHSFFYLKWLNTQPCLSDKRSPLHSLMSNYFLYIWLALLPYFCSNTSLLPACNMWPLPVYNMWSLPVYNIWPLPACNILPLPTCNIWLQPTCNIWLLPACNIWLQPVCNIWLLHICNIWPLLACNIWPLPTYNIWPIHAMQYCTSTKFHYLFNFIIFTDPEEALNLICMEWASIGISATMTLNLCKYFKIY